MSNITIEQIYTFVTHLSIFIGSVATIVTVILKRVKVHIDKNVEDSLSPVYEEIKAIKEVIQMIKKIILKVFYVY